MLLLDQIVIKNVSIAYNIVKNVLVSKLQVALIALFKMVIPMEIQALASFAHYINMAIKLLNLVLIVTHGV